MTASSTTGGYEQLRGWALADGGFGIKHNGDFRPDATAWAIIALKAFEADAGLVEKARRRLAAAQLQDGRLPLFPDHPESYWPTPLAVLAWQGAPAFKEAQERAVAFLLATSGLSLKKDEDPMFSHNPEIPGWSWQADTAAWVEPTAMTMMALEAAGRGAEPRLEEGRLLLLDRQIPGGGWNYGNTAVFGQVLKPMPESTGMALNALGRKAPREDGAGKPGISYGLRPGLAYPLVIGVGHLRFGGLGSAAGLGRGSGGGLSGPSGALQRLRHLLPGSHPGGRAIDLGPVEPLAGITGAIRLRKGLTWVSPAESLSLPAPGAWCWECPAT